MIKVVHGHTITSIIKFSIYMCACVVFYESTLCDVCMCAYVCGGVCVYKHVWGSDNCIICFPLSLTSQFP